MPEFYIVPPRLIVGSFDRANVVTSINNLRGDLTFTADLNGGITVKISGNNIQYSTVPGFFVKRSGDTFLGNLDFTPSDPNYYGLAIAQLPSDPGIGRTGGLYFNTTDGEIRYYYGSTGWTSISTQGGITIGAADGRYLKLDASNDPMQGDLDMGTYFFRLGNKTTPGGPGLAGQLYWDTDEYIVKVYDDNVMDWVPISGGVSGDATTARNVQTTLTDQNLDHYLIFSNTAGTSGVALSSTNGLKINPFNDAFVQGQWRATAIATTYGGTGLTTYLKGDLLVGTGSSLLASLGIGTSRQVLFAHDTLTYGIGWTDQAKVFVSSSAPSYAINSDLWFNNEDGSFNIYYDDGTSKQWVEIVNQFTAEGNITVLGSSDNSDKYLTFVNSSGSGVSVFNDVDLKYNPSSNLLTVGSLSGSAISIRNNDYYSAFIYTGLANTTYTLPENTPQGIGTSILSSSQSGVLKWIPLATNEAGSSTTALNVSLFDADENSIHQLTFTPNSSSSGSALSTDTTLAYNPFTNILFSSGLSVTSDTESISSSTGALIVTGGVGIGGSLNVTGDSLIAGIALSNGFIFGNLVGIASTSEYSYQSGYALTSGIATTATNIDLADVGNENLNYFLVLSENNFGSGVALSSSIGLSYNPQTGVLIGTTFQGNLTGIADTASYAYSSGSATTSNNVNVIFDDNIDFDHPIIFTINTSTVSGAALSSDSGITINPNSNFLSLGSGKLAANGITVGQSANTITSSSGTVKIGDNLQISGNLIVNGDTVTIGSTITTIVDPILVLGSGVGGTQPWIDDNKDRGIEFRYVDGSIGKTGFFGFRDSDKKFVFIPDGWNNNEVFQPTSGGFGTAVFQTVEARLVGIADTSNYSYESGYAISSDSVRFGNQYELGWYEATGRTIIGSGAGLTWDKLSNLLSVYGDNAYIAVGNSNQDEGKIGLLLESTAIKDDVEILNVASPILQFKYNNLNLLHKWNLNSSLNLDDASDINLSYDINGYTKTFFTATGYTFQLDIFSLYARFEGIDGYFGSDLGIGTTLYLYNTASNKTGFQASPSSTGTTVYTLPSRTPAATGTSVLSSSISGEMSWVPLIVGFATTASNVHVATANTSTQHFLTFTRSSSGSGLALSANSTLVYDSFNDRLTSSGVSVTAGTNSTTTSTGALIVTGGVGIGQSLSIGGRLQIFNGANYAAFTYTGSAVTTYTLPATSPSGSGSSFLVSTQSGVMSWSPSPFTSLNGLTPAVQTFSVGTAGVTFNISSSGSVHTFNLPNAGVGTSGLVTGLTQTFGGLKIFSNGAVISPALGTTSGGTGLTGFYSKGDILVGFANTLYQLTVGANNTILIADNAQTLGVKWDSISSLPLSFIGLGSTTIGLGTTLNLVAGSGISLEYTGNNLLIRSGVAITSLYPASSKQGDLLWHDEEGSLKVYYDDGQNEGQWIDASQRWGAGQYVTLPGLGAGSIYQMAYYAASGHTVYGDASFTNNTSTGVVSINHGTGAGSTDTGALVIKGGVGVGETLHARIVRSNTGFIENVYSGGNVSAGSTIFANWSQGSIQTYTLTGACWIGVPSNMPTGASLTLIISQDGTGGWAYTSQSTIKHVGGVKSVIGSAANQIDVLNMFNTGSSYLAGITTGYA